VNREQVEAAAARFEGRRDFLRRTPLWQLPGAAFGIDCAQVWLKLEQFQVGGSFKARGMLNRLLRSGFVILVMSASAAKGAAAASTPEPPGIEAKTRTLLADWKDRFDAEHFHYTTGGPFLIAGDGTEAQLARYRDGTVLAATRALQATYFDKHPAEPVLILLFEKPEPYKRLAKKWFGDDDVPHFGFFRRADHVMLMNVGTGTGTLVHEMVHALMSPDFPDVPDWFNEGLASLYEQCSLGTDTITGHENWRLPDLQTAIRKKTLRPSKSQTSRSLSRPPARIESSAAPT